MFFKIRNHFKKLSRCFSFYYYYTSTPLSKIEPTTPKNIYYYWKKNVIKTVSCDNVFKMEGNKTKAYTRSLVSTYFEIIYYYTPYGFIRNGVKSQLVPFLIFPNISTSFRFLIFHKIVTIVS